ncbi:hypothetical protein [Paenibacillus abyssi]|uniref:Uncharacterized protein n=1 Tax=Paenibacillus abyssi TaxID=1340531 RepID=A0A917D3L2_9BACL|nr:hypothetical protein [Paenibacillus abyssi]GGG09716.1 hypothetical protein GCM10010916_28250 [Paenibacillus abyssi]
MKESNKKPNIQDAFIMAALVIVISLVVDFSNMGFLDIAIVVLGLIWIIMTVWRWLRK